MGGTEVLWEHPGSAQGMVALGGCRWHFFPQTGGGIRHLLEARPEGHGCWGGGGLLGSPALSRTYQIWSRNSTRASWSRRTRAESRTRRPFCRAPAASACTPPSSPCRHAGTGTARLAPAQTCCQSLPVPPAITAPRNPLPQHPPPLWLGMCRSFPGHGGDLQHPLDAQGTVLCAPPRSGCPGGAQAPPAQKG